ncbi:MAG: exodeoxyribonuclease I, partial [Lysobacteraceae bacterium]
DGALYDGFLPESDRRRFADVRSTPPEALGLRDFGFHDPRLPELLFRYRARNWPQTLNQAEFERWNEQRRARLYAEDGESGFAAYRAEIAALRATHAGDGAKQTLLDRLSAWADTLEAELT